ncbi:MAG: hypothetical protein KY395_07445 [Actinobacteria bacterium]|nr:hypothetical protein [Actinomycetota bacterium]
MTLNLKAVGAGAAAMVFPVVAAVLAVRAAPTDETSNLNLVVILTLFVGFAAGGVVAYRVAGLRPLAHSAVAAGVAWVAIAATVVSRGVTLARVITLALLVQVTVGLAVLFAWLSHRRQMQADSAA